MTYTNAIVPAGIVQDIKTITIHLMRMAHLDTTYDMTAIVFAHKIDTKSTTQ